MSARKLSFNESELRSLRNQLLRLETQLEEAKLGLNQADSRFASSLRGSTQNAYQARVQQIDRDVENVIQNLSTLITLMEQSNQNMFALDASVSFTMDFMMG